MRDGLVTYEQVQKRTLLTSHKSMEICLIDVFVLYHMTKQNQNQLSTLQKYVDILFTSPKYLSSSNFT